MLQLFLFGAPRCQQDRHPVHLPRRKCLALLAYLALNPRLHSRAALAAMLYPDSGHARAYLRRTLSEIRRALGEVLLLADGDVQLVENRLWVDVLEFERAAAKGTGSLTEGGVTLSNLQTAVSLYTDVFMAGFTLPDAPAYDEWQFFQTDSLCQKLATILQKLVRWHSRHREFESAVEYGRRWVALDPLHEPAQRALMELYVANGQQAAAVRQYHHFARLLDSELGTAPEKETARLYEAIHFRPGPAAAQPWAAPLRNLPRASMPFVGRSKELQEVGRLITDEPRCRLLTIVGPGGIGKTHLALETARQLLPIFDDGVCLVSLDAVDNAHDLAPAIASALNIQVSRGQPLRAQIIENLRNRHLLLILDGFEQLLAGVDLLTRILTAAPRVKLLVTSRQRLSLASEWAYELTGLSFPRQAAATATVDVLLDIYGAPALFVQRAQQTRSSFRPSSENWPAILRICQLVDGMPLGLELAAGWIPVLSCREIAESIARNLDFLTTTLRDVPDRHRSLRAVFEHSWSLLDADEKGALCRLSIFRGGFSREAAGQVTGKGLLPLAGLVRKSLIMRKSNGRYRVHERLRQFALEKVEDPAATAAARQAHATYFASFLKGREGDLWAGRQLAALNAIAADLDNVRQGWQWAVEQQNVALLNQAATALFLFFDMQGRIQEGERLFRQAARRLQTDSPSAARRVCLGKLLTGKGWFAVWLDSFVKGETCLQQAVTWLRSVEPALPADLSLALNYLGLILCFRGKVAAGETLLQQSLALAWEADSRALVGRSLFNLGQMAVLVGEYRRAETHLEEASRVLSAIGERHRLSLVLNRLGQVAEGLGEYERAERYHQESLEIRKELDDRLRIPGSLQALGYLAYRRGDYARAERLAHECLVMNQQTGNLYETGENYAVLGLTFLARGEFDEAEAGLSRSLAIFREMGIRNRQPEVLNGLARLALARGAYGQAQQLLSESLQLSQDQGTVAHQADTLLVWGDLHLRQGAAPEAGRYYDEALAIAVRIDAAPLALAVCSAAAALFLPPWQPRWGRAGRLLRLVLAHPAAEQRWREGAEALLATVPADLATDGEDAAADLWAVVTALRADLKRI